MLENERKWLVTRPVPEVPKRTRKIEQHYLAVTEDKEVRLRKVDSYKKTLGFKEGKGQERKEASVPLSDLQYHALRPMASGKVAKVRREILTGETLIEVDEYRGDLEGLVVAEVEDPPEDFEPPSWFGDEVTEDERYKNKWLATKGVPTTPLSKRRPIDE